MKIFWVFYSFGTQPKHCLSELVHFALFFLGTWQGTYDPVKALRGVGALPVPVTDGLLHTTQKKKISAKRDEHFLIKTT